MTLPRLQAKHSVGASWLAKDVNDNACLLDERDDLERFASQLAPAVVLSRGQNDRKHKGEPKLPFNVSLHALFLLLRGGLLLFLSP